MAERVLRIKIIFYVIGQKMSTKMYCQGNKQVREAQSSRKKKDKAVFFLENGSKNLGIPTLSTVGQD